MTKNDIIALLARNPLAVEAAILALYRRQTEDEKHTSSTVHSNGRGFNYRHASLGTEYAKWVLGGRRLTPRQLVVARDIASHYARQLLEIAEDKKRAKQKEQADRLEATNVFGETL